MNSKMSRYTTFCTSEIPHPRTLILPPSSNMVFGNNTTFRFTDEEVELIKDSMSDGWKGKRIAVELLHGKHETKCVNNKMNSIKRKFRSLPEC